MMERGDGEGEVNRGSKGKRVEKKGYENKSQGEDTGDNGAEGEKGNRNRDMGWWRESCDVM